MTDPPPTATDVRDAPLIPALHRDGPSVFGLRRLLQEAHKIRDLAIPIPPAASALLRLLYAIVARITRLDDPDLDADEWTAARNALLGADGGFDPDAIDGYLDREDLADRWYLFGGARPFLQDASLTTVCAERAGVNKLVFGRAAANTPVWWEHSTNEDPSPLRTEEAFWHLLVQHYYGPSGKCSARRVAGKAVSNATAGPLRRTVSFHPLGATLYESLILGVPQPGSAESDAEDVCPWEAPALPDPLAPDTLVTWPGDLLTGRSRDAILLVPSEDHEWVIDAYITVGTTQGPREAIDPYVIIDHSKDGRPYARRADASRALWRDLDALLLTSTPAATCRPTIFDIWNQMPARVGERLRVRAYGFDQDGQQVDHSWFTAVTPPVLGWSQENDPAMAHRVAACRATAEDVAKKLEFVSALAWAGAFGPPPKDGDRVKVDPRRPGPWRKTAMAAYWSAAERGFWSLLETDVAPLTVFIADADRALTAAVGGGQHRQRTARALAHARAILWSMLAGSAPTPGSSTDHAEATA